MGFVRAGKVADVPAGTICEAQVKGKTIAMANIDGKSRDPKRLPAPRGTFGPRGYGRETGDLPRHGWSYDVTNGKVGHNQAAGVACYPVEVRGDEIFVNIDGAA